MFIEAAKIGKITCVQISLLRIIEVSSSRCAFFILVFFLTQASCACSVQVKELQNPALVFETVLDLIVRLAQHGLIHCDFNEFNLMVHCCRSKPRFSMRLSSMCICLRCMVLLPSVLPLLLAAGPMTGASITASYLFGALFRCCRWMIRKI